ncbi:MAG: TIGR04255 family protein [Nitriliruptor sp.]|uniref:TIGR04255 family protein n=1 Tax=Nitriliruptor sp. TaxID=2448056 RepID=UPI0034A09B28
MQLPSLPERPAGLPEFGSPPLREVAIAVLFHPLPGLAQAHVGRYWELIRDRYPRVRDLPPIEPYLEAEARGQPLFQLQVGPPPLRRSWFISEDDERLVQLQNDRFVHNWRGDGTSYPHLEDLWSSFAERFTEFAGWVSTEDIGSIEPFQLELTYVNVIEAPSLWDVLRGVDPPVPARFAEDVRTPEPKIELRYEVDGERNAALYVHCRQRDVGVQQIELTFRAALESPEFASLPDAVATGRRLIVTHFTALTTPALHERWDRKR